MTSYLYSFIFNRKYDLIYLGKFIEFSSNDLIPPFVIKFRVFVSFAPSRSGLSASALF